jgi:hypothetical protein
MARYDQGGKRGAHLFFISAQVRGYVRFLVKFRIGTSKVRGGTATGELPADCCRRSSACAVTPAEQIKRQAASFTSFIWCHHHENIVLRLSPTLRLQRLPLISNGDASSIIRGAGHSRPCSPTERAAWYQDRNLEVHSHVFSPQVFIFATCSSSRTNFISATVPFPNKDHCWPILCLTHSTCSGWSNDDSRLIPQCRTSCTIQRSSHSAIVLDASEAVGRASIRGLSSPKSAEYHPSSNLSGWIGNRSKLPFLPPPLPEPRR